MLLLHLRCCLGHLRGHEKNTPTLVRISLAVDSQTGPVGSRYGPGGAASPGTTDWGTSEHTGPLTIHANVRRRLQLRTLLRVRPHTVASDLFALRGEEARAWARTVERKRRFWKGDSRRCCFRSTRQRLHWWDISHCWRRAYPVHELQDRHYTILEI